MKRIVVYSLREIGADRSHCPSSVAFKRSGLCALIHACIYKYVCIYYAHVRVRPLASAAVRVGDHPADGLERLELGASVLTVRGDLRIRRS